jgi:hypothetical protein
MFAPSSMLSKWVLLFHKNARPHSAATTVEAIRQLKFELLPLPAYNPDLALSDYHMFGPLKEALPVRRFGNDEAKESVHTWFLSQPKTFFADEIRRLVNRCAG